MREPNISPTAAIEEQLNEVVINMTANFEKKRNLDIDIVKGILVVGMIWTHCLQFFSKGVSGAAVVENYGDIVSFSGFLFCFGYANQLAYFSGEKRNTLFRMLKTAIKLLIAFYISGTAYELFIKQSFLTKKLIGQILILHDIPGWSEFLAGFFALMTMVILFYKGIQWLQNHPVSMGIVILACLAATYIPYADVHLNQLGLLIGSTRFSSFSVVQYLPWYLCGICLSRYSIKWNLKIFILAILCTAVFAGDVYLHHGNMPQRFPPSLIWVISSAFIIYSYYLISPYIRTIPYLSNAFIMMGRNVLLCLLISNMCIFSLKSAVPYFHLGLAGAFGLAILLIAMSWYFSGISNRYKPGPNGGWNLKVFSSVKAVEQHKGN